MAVPSLTTATVTATVGFTQSGGNLQSSTSLSSTVAWGMGTFDSPATIQENTMKVAARFSASSITQRGSNRGWLSHIWLLSLLVVGLGSAPAHAQNAVILLRAGFPLR